MNRRHDIDALRALAFALLILYHVGMLYVAEWGWHVKSSHSAEWLQWPMLAVNRWRMDLIFLLSGIAASFLLVRRGAGRFFAERSWRLLWPLAFGCLLIVPVQPYAQGVFNGVVEPGYLAFLARYFSGGPWPAEAFDGWEHSFTWNHLWYLVYLWVYCLALVLLLPLLDSPLGRRMQGWITGLRGSALLWLPALPLLLATVALQERFPDSGDLIHDWYRHAIYFGAFLAGVVIGRADRLWLELVRLRRTALGCALGIGAAYLVAVAWSADVETLPTGQLWAIWALRNAYISLALCAILGWSHHLLNRPLRWLPWAREAVYPWYVLHQSLTVLIAYWVVPRGWSWPLELALVLGGTVLGCAAGHALIRRIAWLRPCFGLPMRARDQGAVDSAASRAANRSAAAAA